ncbi:hypothetical protein EfmJHP38_08650 [Enterococcus faecium]|nr:hypothetical protein EfmJHP38_08650 [Enterococcus faecium]
MDDVYSKAYSFTLIPKRVQGVIAMMSKNNTNGRNQFAMLTIDDLVPQDHLVVLFLRKAKCMRKFLRI